MWYSHVLSSSFVIRALLSDKSLVVKYCLDILQHLTLNAMRIFPELSLHCIAGDRGYDPFADMDYEAEARLRTFNIYDANYPARAARFDAMRRRRNSLRKR